MEDRVRSRVNVIAATVAGIRWARSGAVVLRDRLAVLAVNAVRVQAVLEPLKAGRIVRELGVKVFLGVPLHLWVCGS